MARNLGSITEARERVPVSRATFARWLRSGLIRGMLVRSPGSSRGKWLVDLDDLEAFVERGLNEHAPKPVSSTGVNRLDQLAARARRTG